MSCGPGTWGDLLIPDKIFGVDVTRCCTAHDEFYANPRGRSRKDGDRAFLNCLRQRVRVIRPANPGRATARAWVYYAGVRLFGGVAWRRCRRKDDGGRLKTRGL